MADQSECWGWSWADTRISGMSAVWGLDPAPALPIGSVSIPRARPPPHHDPDQPLLREGALGARARRPALPRGAPPPGHPLGARVEGGARLDGAGARPAEGSAAGVGADRALRRRPRAPRPLSQAAGGGARGALRPPPGTGRAE